ncbi:hypothetical protein M9H77_07757 [Catharanthus roseus]|uniref:Uncharacterized protein n=1 Tax=Catharanthus roseus TaxID=4058 RepID=A0ACC0BVU2_CATRO|nr:hypothetical protein M9H77_07757 [Catharanthus roseus]
MEKEHEAILEELSISLSLNPSLMCCDVSLVELELFLESYLSHVKIYGGLFLVVSYVSTCFSSYAVLKSHCCIVSIAVGFGFNGGLSDKCLGKFVENVGYGSSFLDTLMEHHNDFVFLNQLMSFELLLKDIENQMGTNLELFKLNPLVFEKSSLGKEAFEQVCKDFVVGHLYYHKPFKEWFLKLFMSFVSFLKNS